MGKTNNSLNLVFLSWCRSVKIRIKNTHKRFNLEVIRSLSSLLDKPALNLHFQKLYFMLTFFENDILFRNTMEKIIIKKRLKCLLMCDNRDLFSYLHPVATIPLPRSILELRVTMHKQWKQTRDNIIHVNGIYPSNNSNANVMSVQKELYYCWLKISVWN